MRTTLISAFFVAFFGVLPAYARLGETEGQCIARYGKPIEINNPGKNGALYRSLFFSMSDYHIEILILNGICVYLHIQKIDKSPLSDDEIKILLEANADGQNWNTMNKVASDQLWRRDDGAMADYSIVNHHLAFMSKDFIAAEQTKEKSEEKNKLNGF